VGQTSTNFGEWWTTLLLLQMTKKHLKIDNSERIDAMNDAIETIEENTGPQSRWSLEIMASQGKVLRLRRCVASGPRLDRSG